MSQQVTVKERLLKGARLLGELWRANERCEHGFGVVGSLDSETGITDCFCEPKTKFCKCRDQWFSLAVLKDERVPWYGDYGMLEMMTGKEWDETGLTVTFDLEKDVRVSVGPKGVIGRKSLAMLFESQRSVKSILPVLSRFHGCEVFGIEKTEEKPVEPSTEEVVS